MDDAHMWLLTHAVLKLLFHCTTMIHGLASACALYVPVRLQHIVVQTARSSLVHIVKLQICVHQNPPPMQPGVKQVVGGGSWAPS